MAFQPGMLLSSKVEEYNRPRPAWREGGSILKLLYEGEDHSWNALLPETNNQPELFLETIETDIETIVKLSRLSVVRLRNQALVAILRFACDFVATLKVRQKYNKKFTQQRFITKIFLKTKNISSCFSTSN